MHAYTNYAYAHTYLRAGFRRLFSVHLLHGNERKSIAWEGATEWVCICSRFVFLVIDMLFLWVVLAVSFDANLILWPVGR